MSLSACSIRPRVGLVVTCGCLFAFREDGPACFQRAEDLYFQPHNTHDDTHDGSLTQRVSLIVASARSCGTCGRASPTPSGSASASDSLDKRSPSTVVACTHPAAHGCSHPETVCLRIVLRAVLTSRSLHRTRNTRSDRSPGRSLGDRADCRLEPRGGPSNTDRTAIRGGVVVFKSRNRT
eukprot:7384738-Prymnesium_polylepis.2